MNYDSYELIQGNIYLEITSKCNLHCDYCYNDSQINGKQLPFDMIKNLMDYLTSVNVYNMAISGGEPILHPDIINIIEYASRINMHLYVVTNGSMFNIEFFEKIKPFMRFLSFQFTFDGNSVETHGRTRGKDNYFKIKYWISRLIDEGYGDKIYIRYNITTYNYLEVYNFLEYCNKTCCKSVSLSFVLNQGRANEAMLVTEIQEKNVKSAVGKARKNFPNLEIRLTDKPVITCPYVLFRPDQKLSFLPRIDSEGNVYPCQVEVNPDCIIGNIYENNMFDIMHSKKFQHYITFVTEKEQRNINCRSCKFAKLCGGGCIAMQTSCNKIKSELLHVFLR